MRSNPAVTRREGETNLQARADEACALSILHADSTRNVNTAAASLFNRRTIGIPGWRVAVRTTASAAALPTASTAKASASQECLHEVLLEGRPATRESASVAEARPAAAPAQ